MRKLEELLSKRENTFYQCSKCGMLFTATQKAWLFCHKAKSYVDFHGNLVGEHTPKKNWDIQKYLLSLRTQHVPWKQIFWRFWALCHHLQCSVCQQPFIAAYLPHCCYHPREPSLTNLSSPPSAPLSSSVSPTLPFHPHLHVTGSYPCCQSVCYRYSMLDSLSGCRARNHTIDEAHATSHREVLDLLFKHYQDAVIPFQEPPSVSLLANSPPASLVPWLTLGVQFQPRNEPLESKEKSNTESKRSKNSADKSGGGTGGAIELKFSELSLAPTSALLVKTFMVGGAGSTGSSSTAPSSSSASSSSSSSNPSSARSLRPSSARLFPAHMFSLSDSEDDDDISDLSFPTYSSLLGLQALAARWSGLRSSPRAAGVKRVGSSGRGLTGNWEDRERADRGRYPPDGEQFEEDDLEDEDGNLRLDGDGLGGDDGTGLGLQEEEEDEDASSAWSDEDAEEDDDDDDDEMDEKTRRRSERRPLTSVPKTATAAGRGGRKRPTTSNSNSASAGAKTRSSSQHTRPGTASSNLSGNNTSAAGSSGGSGGSSNTSGAAAGNATGAAKKSVKIVSGSTSGSNLSWPSSGAPEAAMTPVRKRSWRIDRVREADRKRMHGMVEQLNAARKDGQKVIREKKLPQSRANMKLARKATLGQRRPPRGP